MAILKTTLANGEARYHSMQFVAGMTKPRMVRKWQFVDPTYADTLIDDAGATVTNPKVDGQEYAGVFNHKMTVGEGEDDRSVTIYQTLWLDTGMFKYASLTSTLRDDITYAYKQYSTVVAAPADSQGNIYTAQNNLRDDGTYDAQTDYQVSNAKTTNFTSFDAHFRNTESILYDNSRTAITAPAAGAGGVYSVVGQNQKDDGTYDGRLDYDVSSNAGLYEFESLNSTLREDDTVIYKEYGLPLTAPGSGTGAIYRAGNSITDRGTYNSQLDYQKSQAHTAKYTRTQSKLLDRVGTLHENQTSIVSAAADEVGKIYDATNRMNQDGTYSGDSTSTVSNPVEYTFPSQSSTGMTETTSIYQNRLTGVPSGSASVGTSYRTSNRVNQDGTYDGQIQKRTKGAMYSQWQSHVSGLRNDKTYLYQGNTVPALAGNSGVGYVYNVSNRRNEDGSYDGSGVYQVNSPAAIYQVFNARNGEGYFYNFRSQPYAVARAYATYLPANAKNSVSVSMNDDLTYNGLVSTQPTSGSLASHFSNFARHRYIYHTRVYPEDRSKRQQMVDHWAIYNTFSASSTTAAGDCHYGYNTSVTRAGGALWMAQYWIPQTMATSWTVMT